MAGYTAAPPSPVSSAGMPHAGGRRFWEWFPSFLGHELAPYKGRAALVTRTTIATVMVMVIIMVFRLPGGANAVFFSLIIPRDSLLSTLKGCGNIFLGYLLATVYVIVSAMLFMDYPMTHFLWVIASIFLAFFALRVVPSPNLNAPIAFGILTAIPIWDATKIPTAALVTATLWNSGCVAITLAASIAVEYAFSLFHSSNPLWDGLVERLHAVSAFLRSRSSGESSTAAEENIARFAMVGVSRLRVLAFASSTDRTTVVRRSANASLTGRLVDVCAGMAKAGLSAPDCARATSLADRIDAVAYSIVHPLRAMPDHAGELEIASAPELDGVPQLAELERTTRLLELNRSSALKDLAPEAKAGEPPPAPPVMLEDAFTNRAHLVFALRGTLAASACYFIINAIDYRQLSTSLITCAVSALGSVGSSRQKQLLRISGAAIGGLILGMGSQILVLPKLNGIGGFVIFFAVVTALSSWVATSSPRLAYMGLQIGLAFYLINVQEFAPQTNLAVGRDRVVGVALGLLAMWFFFDTVGSVPAVRVMLSSFEDNLRMLAQYVQLWRTPTPEALKQVRRLRDNISAGFDSVNGQGDAVLFEIGPARQHNLAVRRQLMDWQPRLRSAFLILIGLGQFRFFRPGGELPPAVADALDGFDRELRDTLAELAGAVAGDRDGTACSELRPAFQRVVEAVRREEPVLTDREKATLSMQRDLVGVLENFHAEVAQLRPQALRAQT